MSNVCIVFQVASPVTQSGKGPVNIQHMHTHIHTYKKPHHALHKGNYAHTVILSKHQNQQTALKWYAQQKEMHLMQNNAAQAAV